MRECYWDSGQGEMDSESRARRALVVVAVLDGETSVAKASG